MSTTKLTIGILAHVDAGKTTLTEAMLYKAGATRNRGSVDKGSAITDGLAMEKERGISIKTATVNFTWNTTEINLIDTPGHIDFSAEVNRSLAILDLVILVVSAVESVQANTLSLWESLKEYNIPTIVFINKIDRTGADIEQVFTDIENDLQTQLFALNLADTSNPDTPQLIDFEKVETYSNNTIIEKSYENLAAYNDVFLEAFLSDTLPSSSEIKLLAKQQIQQQNIVPVYFGSGKLDLGITNLLNAITNLYIIEEPTILNSAAKVFKVSYDERYGRLAYIKNYGTVIKTKDSIWSQALNKEVKINQILKQNLGSFTPINEITTGAIAAVNASEIILAGDVLGKHEFNEANTVTVNTVLSVQVVAENDKDYQKLGEALEILNIEDPQLDFKWLKSAREFHLRILGPIQTEVLKDSLQQRFTINANFLKTSIVYKETPKKSAEGFVRYWMPKPSWAIMTFLIEPDAPNSGVVFESKVRTSNISTKYQNEVKRAIPWSLRQGIKGWEVTDIKITLLEGSEHQVHSNPGDFLLATPMGVLRGIEKADTDLLEPMYAFQIKAHQDYLGAVSSDLNQMQAQINAPNFKEEFFTLTGRVAVAKAIDYGIKFAASTSGKGRLQLKLDGYEKTTFSEDKTRAYQGVCPLDEAQWILHKRGAFKADERKNW